MKEELLNALNVWALESTRHVNIKIDSDGSSIVQSVWCFDFEVMEGKFVERVADIPTTKELKDIKRKTLEATLSEL